MRRRILFVTLCALPGWSCATTTPQSATPVEPAPATTQTSSVTQTKPPPAPEPERPRSIEEAQALVEQGREVQRTKGEGGAQEAVTLYRQALEKDHLCESAFWELGWSYQVLDRWEDALTAWDELKKINPSYPELAQHYPIAKMRRDQAVALANLPDPGMLPEPELEPRKGPVLRIAAVGDVQMGRAWPEERASLPPDDAADLFAGVKDHLGKTDVTFGNLETVLADEGKSKKCGPKSKHCFAFRVPTAYAKVLRSTGFTVMSIANNHTGDFGPEGRVATMEALDAAGLLHSGPVGDIASWESKGLRIALIAFSTGQGLYRVQDIDVARKVVADADRDHDLIIVSFHGGAEGRDASRVPIGEEMFLGENRGDVRSFAHAVVDSGADLVIGHGPHLLRGTEIYKSRFITYSMGNFSSWETFSLKGALGLTAILEVELSTNGVVTKAKMTPVAIVDPGRPVVDKSGKSIELVRELSRLDFEGPVFDESGHYVRSQPVSAELTH